MGWWEVEGGLSLGDGPLDLTEEFLIRFRREYEAGLGRRPHIEEVLQTLTQTLGSRSEDFVATEGSVVVTEIRAKSKKVAKLKLAPGDIFRVPIGGGAFAFGRLTPQLSVADFFDISASKTVRTSQLLQTRTFRLPGLLMLDPLREGRWKIIDRLAYPDPPSFMIQPFRIGGQIECGDAVVAGFIDPSSRLREASSAEAHTIPEHSLWNAELVERELAKRFANSS